MRHLGLGLKKRGSGNAYVFRNHVEWKLRVIDHIYDHHGCSLSDRNGKSYLNVTKVHFKRKTVM